MLINWNTKINLPQQIIIIKIVLLLFENDNQNVKLFKQKNK